MSKEDVNVEIENRDTAKSGPKKIARQKRPKNPLFVVTNDGKDVEQADNVFEALVKRFGLEPAVEILNSLIKLLFENVKSYAMFVVLKEYFDQVVEMLEAAVETVDDKLRPYTEIAQARLESLLTKIPGL